MICLVRVLSKVHPAQCCRALLWQEPAMEDGACQGKACR